MSRKNEKDHRSKKNPRSREVYEEQRREKNRSRGKQVWVIPSPGNGRWERETT